MLCYFGIVTTNQTFWWSNVAQQNTCGMIKFMYEWYEYLKAGDVQLPEGVNIVQYQSQTQSKVFSENSFLSINTYQPSSIDIYSDILQGRYQIYILRYIYRYIYIYITI